MLTLHLFTDGDRQLSLQSEIHSSIKSRKKSSKARLFEADQSDTDSDAIEPKESKFKNTFATYKLATANKMHIGGMSSDSPIPTYNPGLGSSFDEKPKIMKLDEDTFSYTISRNDSRSPTAFIMELEDSKTSDTLTMTPAGARMDHPRLSHPLGSIPDQLGLGHSRLGSIPDHAGLGQPALGSNMGHPGLGQPTLGSIPLMMTDGSSKA